LARIAASIGILIVHTPPYQPEGRGKIERFFRSSVVDNRRTVMWSLQLCGPGIPNEPTFAISDGFLHHIS
jgi:transposase InsO family protein